MPDLIRHPPYFRAQQRKGRSRVKPGMTLGRDLFQCILDRLDGLLGLRAIGPAALSHVGPAAAALTAKRRDRRLDEVDGAHLAGEIVGHSDGDAGSAFVDSDKSAD